jgi:hypothetical protein
MSMNKRAIPVAPGRRHHPRGSGLAAAASRRAGRRRRADPADRALCARRPDRRDGARAGRAGQGQPGHCHHREPPGRRRQHRRRPGGQGRAGRPRSGSRHWPRMPSTPGCTARCPTTRRSDFAPITQMVRVPNVLVMNTDTANRLEHPHPGRPGPLCQGQPRAAELRLRRQRQRRAPGRRDVQGAGRHLRGAHPLQRWQSGAVGAAVGAGGFQLRQPGHRGGEHPLGQAASALAVTTAQRSPALPDVEPVSDTYKGFAVDTWWGLVAPAGTPRDVVATSSTRLSWQRSTARRRAAASPA